jgi:hypothetical protein
MGRFMTADWGAIPMAVPYAVLGNPQTLNLYSYVENNPATSTDPDGHVPPDGLYHGDAFGGASISGDDVGNFFAGLGNALSSDNLAGFGRLDQGTTAGQVGAATGDALALVQGAVEFITGGTMAVGGSAEAVVTSPAAGTGAGAVIPGAGVATATAGVALAGHGTVVLGTAIKNMGFAKSVKDAARAEAGGKCQYCGEKTTQAQKSEKGVTPSRNEGQTDHYNPASKGGSDHASNAVHACRGCNQEKSDVSPRGTKWENPD